MRFLNRRLYIPSLKAWGFPANFGKGLKIAELVEKLGKSRQAIESARDKGTLSEIGYRADKNGKNWFYYPLAQTL